MGDDMLNGGLGNFWDTALTFGSAEYGGGRSALTVPTNAVQSMQPVQAEADTTGWSGFWRDTLKGVVGYAVAKDAAKSGLQPVQQQTATGAAPQPAADRPAVSGQQMLLVAALIGGVYLIAKG